MKRFFDACYVGALALYILAGCWFAPFHGDESTIIYMSRDFDTLFRRGDLAHILYRDPPPADDPQSATLQDLRLLNGVINKYGYGLAWSAAGLTAHDLNDQWLWGADLSFNVANGHVPSAQLLFICRVASALLTALSVALVFVIGKRAGGRRTAYIAAFIYALMPAVLLNGRRAMMESGLLLFSALLVYVGQRVAGTLISPPVPLSASGEGESVSAERSFEKPNSPRSKSLPAGGERLPDRLRTPPLRQRRGGRGVRSIFILGLAAGLTIASKHTGLITVAAILGAIGLYALLTQPLARTIRVPIYLGAALLAALGVFLALNVAWWSDPLGMPRRVLAARQDLLNGQVKAFGGFVTTQERIMALIREPLSAPPQYYEVRQGWPDWIGGQIAGYEAAGLAGLSGTLWTVLVGILVIIGSVRALIHWRCAPLFVILVWAGVTLLAVYVLTPLDWQRYYLPLAAPSALLCGIAFARFVQGRA